MAIERITIESKESKALIKLLIPNLKASKKIKLTEVNDLDRLKLKKQGMKDEFLKVEESFNKKNISTSEYERKKKEYTYDLQEIDIEILTRQKDFAYRNSHNKRLSLLEIMLKVCQTNDNLEINGQIITMDSLYQNFMNAVLTEAEEQLVYQQKIDRSKLIFNMNDYKVLEQNHKFYLNDEQILKTKDNLYNLDDTIKNIKGKKENPGEVDFSKLTATDFISDDVMKAYDKLFNKELDITK